MSEFTAGCLFLRSQQEQLETRLAEIELPGQVRELNDKWGVLLLEDTWGQRAETGAGLQQLAERVPFLHFFNGSDHGWAYFVYEGGAVRAAVDVSYERDYNMAVSEVERLHPEVEVVHEFTMTPEGREVWDRVFAAVRSSSAYREAVLQQYANRNVEAFRCFDVTEEQVQQLSELLTGDCFFTNPLEDSPWEQVEKFKAILGIEEMAWMS